MVSYTALLYTCVPPLQKTITVPNKSETNRQNESGTTQYTVIKIQYAYIAYCTGYPVSCVKYLNVEL